MKINNNTSSIVSPINSSSVEYKGSKYSDILDVYIYAMFQSSSVNTNDFYTITYLSKSFPI